MAATQSVVTTELLQEHLPPVGEESLPSDKANHPCQNGVREILTTFRDEITEAMERLCELEAQASPVIVTETFVVTAPDPIPATFQAATRQVIMEINTAGQNVDLTGWTPSGLKCPLTIIRFRKTDTSGGNLTWTDATGETYSFTDQKSEYMTFTWDSVASLLTII